METGKGKGGFSLPMSPLPLPRRVVFALLRHRSAVMVKRMARWGVLESVHCVSIGTGNLFCSDTDALQYKPVDSALSREVHAYISSMQ